MSNINKPILILGCSKSGSTLMRNLFDGHKDLFIIPTESHFFQNIRLWISYHFRRMKPQKIGINEMKRNLIDWINYVNSLDNKITDGFTQRKWDLKLFEDNIQNSDVNDLLSLSNLYVESMYMSLYSKEYNNNLRFVEKSVENAEMAMDWSKLYPEARFVYILRNPYSNLVAIRNYQSNGKKKFPSIKSALYSMYNSYYYMYKNLRLLPNIKVIKYEDLIQDPENTMKKVAGFLGLEYSDILTKPTLFGTNWQGNSTTGVKFNGISKMNLERWKSIITPLEIEIINKLFDFVLDDFGYKKIKSSKSMLFPNKKESIRNYFLNRLLWYYMPRF